MNYLIAGIGANVTLSLISAITATTNGVYTLVNNVSSSTATGAGDIKLLIKKKDLEMKMKMMQYLLCEITIDDNSPITLHWCIKGIHDAIKDITDVLHKINYRMQYNNSLLIGASVRSYSFHNCYKRLEAAIETLENRYEMLINILKIKKNMYKNEELESALSESQIVCDKLDMQTANNIRKDVHDKLQFIRDKGDNDD